MNVKNQHPENKSVSLAPLFKGTDGSVTSMSLAKGGVLPPHVTKIPALLICILGHATYATESLKIVLHPGDYVEIEPMVEHWVTGIEESQLLLIK